MRRKLKFVINCIFVILIAVFGKKLITDLTLINVLFVMKCMFLCSSIIAIMILLGIVVRIIKNREPIEKMFDYVEIVISKMIQFAYTTIRSVLSFL